MKTITEQKAYAVDRLTHFLEELKKAENPFDVEAKVYTLSRVAQSVHKKMHEINSAVPHECDHKGVRPDVFESIFGGGLGRGLNL